MKIGVVHPDLDLKGGGEYVTVEIIQALRDDHELELISFTDPDLEGLNDFFGTSLSDDDFSVLRPFFSFMFSGGSMFKLRNFALKRYASMKSGRYDLLISGLNEADFPGNNLQYVHFPDAVNEQHFHKTGQVETRQSLGAEGLYRIYTNFVDIMASYDAEEVGKNYTVVNSEFTGEVFSEVYGHNLEVLNPPVSIEFEDIPEWESREERFTCIGKVSPPKRQKDIIRIVKRLNEKGYDIGLDIIGKLPKSGYADEVADMAKREDFVDLHGSLSRIEMKEIMKENKYGIHGFPGEHYGLAPAEMVKAGCIVFVPDRGGQKDILGDERFLYSDVDDAVEKISYVLDLDDKEELRKVVDSRKNRLNTPNEFRNKIRSIVEGEDWS